LKLESIKTPADYQLWRMHARPGDKVKYKAAGDLDESIVLESAVKAALILPTDVKVTRRSRTSYLLTKRKTRRAKGDAVSTPYTHTCSAASINVPGTIWESIPVLNRVAAHRALRKANREGDLDRVLQLAPLLLLPNVRPSYLNAPAHPQPKTKRAGS
jgi:hypothetical protein